MLRQLIYPGDDGIVESDKSASAFFSHSSAGGVIPVSGNYDSSIRENPVNFINQSFYQLRGNVSILIFLYHIIAISMAGFL